MFERHLTPSRVTKTHEPIRPIYAPDASSPYCYKTILSRAHRVFYGESTWPSRSYWLVSRDDYED